MKDHKNKTNLKKIIERLQKLILLMNRLATVHFSDLLCGCPLAVGCSVYVFLSVLMQFNEFQKIKPSRGVIIYPEWLTLA